MIGSFSSNSSAINRRLAFSAPAKAASALVSVSPGLVRVSAHAVHSFRSGLFSTSQLHSARCSFAHNSYLSASTKPGWALSSPDSMTNSAMSCSEKPSELPQDRQTEFSNARCWPHLGQMKSRMCHFSFERRHVDRDVDNAALGVGVDDAAQGR